MTAKEMFEKLGFIYSECYYHHKLDSILYKRTEKRANQVEFMLDRKLYKVFFEISNVGTYELLPSAVDMELHKAINKQIEELGWDNEKI